MVRVQPLLDCLERVSEQFGTLAVVLAAVIAAERMVVGNGSARLHNGL